MGSGCFYAKHEDIMTIESLEEDDDGDDATIGKY
jgi:hypothetical protein